MTAYADAFLADLNVAVEAAGSQISSRQLKALAAVTAARLEAQEARLERLEGDLAEAIRRFESDAFEADIAKARYGE